MRIDDLLLLTDGQPDPATSGKQVFVAMPDGDLVECLAEIDCDGDMIITPLSWRPDGGWTPDYRTSS